MAKIAFTKLGLAKNQEVRAIELNGQTIEVIQYLPYNDKLELMSRIINLAADEKKFYNPAKIDFYTKLEVLFAYTNISFTPKQKEDLSKLYDLFDGVKFFDRLYDLIPEIKTITNIIQQTIESIYSYNNSIAGILESVTQDYKDTEFDINKLQEMLTDESNLTLLKQIAPIAGLK